MLRWIKIHVIYAVRDDTNYTQIQSTKAYLIILKYFDGGRRNSPPTAWDVSDIISNET